MRCIVHPSATDQYQELGTSWQGEPVTPPFYFRFHEEDHCLIFTIKRQAPAIIHPQARPCVFQENLWRYDVTEFFIATTDARRYLEFNLCPNGAWWAEHFTDPRVKLPGFDAALLCPIISATMAEDSWQTSVKLPLAYLQEWGFHLPDCRLTAAAVICREGDYTYLTTCEQRSGKPDFHHPWDWEMAQRITGPLPEQSLR